MVLGFLPTSQPGVVNYVGECGSNYLCDLCEGDCDSDSDCAGDLICLQRDGFEAVPGCSGEGGARDVYAKDICVDKQASLSPSALPSASPVELTASPSRNDPTEILHIGPDCTVNFASGKCSICTGDCDSDYDCADGLRCVARELFDGFENVPGCNWGANSEKWRNLNGDYCE
jgi:hypothetical protein